MHSIGLIHVGFAVTALVAGLGVVLRPKGTRRHRRLGWVYAASMVGLNGTAFMLYRLFGGFGPFHVAALVSLATVMLGVLPAARRRPRGKWVEHHAYWMSWSYVGLLAAAASEVATRVPETPFWGMVLISTLMIVGAGMVLINTFVPRILRTIGRP